MDHNVRTLIEYGMPVIEAYKAGSFNPARHWHYEHQIGSLAPGRYADIVLLRDPAAVDIARVYANGELVAEDGELLVEPVKIDWPSWATDTMNVREVSAEDFVVPAPEDTEFVTAAILSQFYFAPEYMTAELQVEDGVVLRDIPNGISKFCIVDRYNNLAEPVACMFWRDVGPITPNTAYGSSIAHDHHNIWVLGSSDEAMAQVANRLVEIGGGRVLVSEGEVVDEVQLEIGGLMTARPYQETAADEIAFWNTVEQFEWLTSVPKDSPAYGSEWLNQLKWQIFATLTCTPWKWVLVAPFEGCPSGFVNVTTGECSPVVW